LRSPLILQLYQAALDGIHPLAGTWRNTKVAIGKSKHVPPEAAFVSEEIQFLCDYVNQNWAMNADHLGAYVLWKLNWIHPFADGNGRTARAVAYVVMSAKLDSLLPGAPTIPEQIAADKGPYYKALEAADQHLIDGKVDVTDLEKMLNAMLATQLLNAHKQASGEIAGPGADRNFH
jgi:Fic family protein